MLFFAIFLIACHKKRGITPLITACTYGHKDVVEVLLAAGAEVNVTDQVFFFFLLFFAIFLIACHKKRGITPLRATHHGWTEDGLEVKSYRGIVQLLLSAGAEIDEKAEMV